MSTFGINVFDSDGKKLIDNEKLLHRVWHQGMYTSNQTIYYLQPLNHKPTVITYGVERVYPCGIQHVVDASGNYLGLTLNFSTYGSGATIIVVFARR